MRGSFEKIQKMMKGRSLKCPVVGEKSEKILSGFSSLKVRNHLLLVILQWFVEILLSLMEHRWFTGWVEMRSPIKRQIFILEFATLCIHKKLVLPWRIAQAHGVNFPVFGLYNGSNCGIEKFYSWTCLELSVTRTVKKVWVFTEFSGETTHITSSWSFSNINITDIPWRDIILGTAFHRPWPNTLTFRKTRKIEADNMAFKYWRRWSCLRKMGQSSVK